jgi:hypothetical protein
VAVGRRRPTNEAAGAAFLLVFGTSVWAASQSWSSVLAAALAVALAVLCLVRAEDEVAWADRAGFFLPVAAAFDPPAVALAVVVLGGILARWPRRVSWLAAHVAVGLVVALLVRAALPLSVDVSSLLAPGPGASPFAFFFSPARGVVVFSLVALVAAWGLVRALRRGPRFLPATLLAGFLARRLGGPAPDRLPACRVFGRRAGARRFHLRPALGPPPSHSCRSDPRRVSMGADPEPNRARLA